MNDDETTAPDNTVILPAVSFAMFLSGSLSASTFLAYAVVQLLGGLTAVYAYRATVM